MKKIATFILLLLVLERISAQQVLLFSENFDPYGNTFNLNTAGAPSSNTGYNQWVINDSFNGQPLYINTPNEDSVVLGTIYDAPYSHYLHIYDTSAASQGIANANWNLNSVSDRFCYIGSPFCTQGYTNVSLTFFWICEGDSNAYGQVYYSADGGPWTACGQAKYYNQPLWKEEYITAPAFNNLENLQFGFRWVNNASASSNVSFGIDDIIAIGDYDSITNPVTMNVSILDTPYCEGNPLLLDLVLSEPLCEGSYDIQLSTGTGSFEEYYDLGTLAPGFSFDSLIFSTLGPPDDLTGNCYRVRVVRIAPPPVVTSDTTYCFGFINCPNYIFNEGNVVMQADPDTVCVLSEVDITFNSTGIFAGDNVYIAVLYDSIGGLLDSIAVLGTLPTGDSFPSLPPGDVSGKIPASVPPGCGYYVRVISTNPYTVGPLIGPYCIRHCDEYTNNATDIHLCVASGPYPECDTIDVQPHEWNDSASYASCNEWEVQLLDMMNLAILNTGGLGIYYDSAGGYFKLCAPSTADSLPVAPGEYYMRIISTCSSEQWNQQGTIIRITIGAPNPIPPVITLNDSVFCEYGLIQLTVNPFNSPPSMYQWSSNLLNDGNPFIWPYDPLSIQLNPQVTPGNYVFYVMEINYGCDGPSSAPANITIVQNPGKYIEGPALVCLGDTILYHVDFFPGNYYEWGVPPGVNIVASANSETYLTFDSLGVFNITDTTTGSCGNFISPKYPITVIPPMTINISNDTFVCVGQSITVNAVGGNDREEFLVQDTGTDKTKQGGMFDLIAHAHIVLDSFAVRFLTTSNTVDEAIYWKSGSYRTYETTPSAWTGQTGYNNFPAVAGQMTMLPIYIDLPMAPGDTMGFYVTTTNTSPIVYEANGGANGPFAGTVYSSDGRIDFVQGSANDYPFGSFTAPRILNIAFYYTTSDGLHYIWSNGDTSSVLTVTPQQSGTYNVKVYDTSGCSNYDSVSVQVKPLPNVYAGPDTTVCPESNYQMEATSTASKFAWQPGIGLSDSTILDPVFNYKQGENYYLFATDTFGCKGEDSVQISVVALSINAGPDTTICGDSSYIFPATSSTLSVVWTPSSGLNDSNLINPTFYINVTQTEKFLFKITGTDNFGCTVSDSFNLTVNNCPSGIWVASAFIPGSQDNDHFTVFGASIRTYEITIFNRWGEEVYHSADLSELNDRNKGWDGTYKGKVQDSGTFVYYIDAIDDLGRTITKKGNITLVR